MSTFRLFGAAFAAALVLLACACQPRDEIRPDGSGYTIDDNTGKLTILGPGGTPLPPGPLGG